MEWSSRLRRACLVGAMLSCGLVSTSSVSAAAPLNVTGKWNSVYHCKTGWCKGQDFPSPGSPLIQANGSTKVMDPTGAVTGTLVGHTLTLHGAGSYSWDAVLTISADGNSWEGTLHDSNKTSGTDTATRVDAPAAATLSVKVAVGGQKASVGSEVSVKATVTAHGGDLSDVTLGKGLVSSDGSVSVVKQATGLSGFALAEDASRTFDFTVKGMKAGKADLTVSASGSDGSGTVRASGQATLTIAGPGIVVNTSSDSAIDPKALAAEPPRCAIDHAAAKPECSLRAAIQLVNKLGGTQSIDFDIPGAGVPRITPKTSLPTVDSRVAIDGTTQGGWVELSGASAEGSDGLTLAGPGASVRGLVINGFAKGAGVKLTGQNELVAGDRIGTSVGGTAAIPNEDGVAVTGPDATIGGTGGTSAFACTGDCNLISGDRNQILATTNGSVTFGGLTVEGDWIGVDSTGEHAVSPDEATFGVYLESESRSRMPDSDQITIGGKTSRPGLAPGNLIDASRVAVSVDGLLSRRDGGGVAVSGNLIGLDSTGTKAVGGHDGVLLCQTTAELGGTDPRDRNVIGGLDVGVLQAGGYVDGNYIGTDITGMKAVGNDVGVDSDSGPSGSGPRSCSSAYLGDRNVISGNKIGVQAGYQVSPGYRDLIGLAANGLSALPNDIGISAPSVDIGREGTCPANPCDVISGNRVAGIKARPGFGDSNSFQIKGAYIGTDITGNRSVPNGVGVEIAADPQREYPPYLLLGGPSNVLAGRGCNYPCNIIAGNSGAGLTVNMGTQEPTNPASFRIGRIMGSLFGTGADGSAMPNGGPGIEITGSADTSETQIGGDPARGNLLAGGPEPAVRVDGPSNFAKTPRVSLLANQYEMPGDRPPIVRPTSPAAPKLQITTTAGGVEVTGSTNAPADPTGSGETVEIYAGAACGKTRQAIAQAPAARLSGEFTIHIPLATIRRFPFLSVLRTDDDATTSRFLPGCDHVRTP
jgi:hypothetical protein